MLRVSPPTAKPAPSPSTAATNQTIVTSSFYDRFTENLQQLLSRLLEHALDEVAVSHHISPEFDRFRDVIAADATISRLQQLLAEFQATHDDASGVMLSLVHNVTDQSVISDEITDETTHESTRFETGTWLRGRLFLLDLRFFKYRRFALIDETDGFFLSRLKQSSNPLITPAIEINISDHRNSSPSGCVADFEPILRA